MEGGGRRKGRCEKENREKFSTTTNFSKRTIIMNLSEGGEDIGKAIGEAGRRRPRRRKRKAAETVKAAAAGNAE